jgi:mRNA-degrading endonuclease RelE of RelBE toxin-antitoxin system
VRYLERVPGDVQRRVVARLDQVAGDPFGPHTKPLAGPGDRRSARVGALRIVFTVDRDRRVVDVSDIGPRGQIYRGL